MPMDASASHGDARCFTGCDLVIMRTTALDETPFAPLLRHPTLASYTLLT
jgi:hypothetical protein